MNPSSRILLPPRIRGRQGFTLIELLTVVAIIGILALIVFLSVGRIRESAQRSVCLANLRQIQAANMLHAAENRGNYVQIKKDDKWWIAQENFVRYLNANKRTSSELHSVINELKCPAATDFIAGLSNSWEREHFIGIGYATNGATATSPGNFSSINQNNIANPANAIAFSDALDFYFYKTPPANYDWANERRIGTTMSYRHRNGRAAVYFDGHAQWVPAP